MSYGVGIDVGTSFTGASVCRSRDGHAELEVVPLGTRSAAVPSVLFLGGRRPVGRG